MRIHLTWIMVIGLALVLTGTESGFAQLGKLKSKVKKEVEKKATEPKKTEEPKKDSTASAETEPQAAKSDSAAPAADNFQLYTKFDFVPGQKVLFYDDLSQEELGEFPSRWNLKSGVFENAKVGNDMWIMASSRGEIRPKLNINQLPEKYTIEFEFLNRTSVYNGAHYIEFSWVKADDYPTAHLRMFSNTKAYFNMSDDKGAYQSISDIQLPESYATGIHHFRMMVTKSSVKCYIDNMRLVNAPRTAGFLPVALAITFHADDNDWAKEKMFIRNFRFAEGGKTMKEQLDEDGHIVTHGIYFDVNSDKIKGESYKTLADIIQMLTESPALRVSIDGHTDSDGSDDSNLDLSKRRAESVKAYLVENGKIDASRLEAKGFGETKPIDANTTPEGKANNRRVELTKL